MPAKPTPAQKADAQRLKGLFEQKKGEQGFTQATVADDFGIGQSAVGQYLNGNIPLNVDVAIKFARLLHCSIGDFSRSLQAEINKKVTELSEWATLNHSAQQAASVYKLHDENEEKDPHIKEAIKLMRATDETGRILAIGGIRGALQGYKPAVRKNPRK